MHIYLLSLLLCGVIFIGDVSPCIGSITKKVTVLQPPSGDDGVRNEDDNDGSNDLLNGHNDFGDQKVDGKKKKQRVDEGNAASSPSTNSFTPPTPPPALIEMKKDVDTDFDSSDRETDENTHVHWFDLNSDDGSSISSDTTGTTLNKQMATISNIEELLGNYATNPVVVKLLCVLIILLGLLFCFFGLQFKVLMLFMNALCLITCFVYMLTFGIAIWVHSTLSMSTLAYISCGVGILLGLIGGSIATRKQRFGAALVGTSLGLIVGIQIDFISQSIYYGTSSSPGVYPGWATWLAILLGMLLFSLSARWFVDGLIMVSTSAVGGYAVCRGVGVISLTWPTKEQVRDGDARPVWLWFLAVLLFSVLGLCVQYKCVYLPQKRMSEKYNVYFRSNK